MNLETFFEKFELFADAPSAVAKMRELVLELAVRGELTDQVDSDNDDPAWQEFTARISMKTEQSGAPNGLPFDIPGSWHWTTLNELGITKPRNEAPDAEMVSFVPMALVPAELGQNIQHEVRQWHEIKKGYTHFADGDVVLAKITPCYENGKSAVIAHLTAGIGAGTTELHVFRPTTKVIQSRYALIYLKTRGFIERGIPKMTGSAGQKRVPHDYFANSPFPLPPFGEQKRIVAKVDELMALCDRLEAQQNERAEKHAALARASLARFTEAPTPANLDFLFHKSYDITPADLRKTILTLAVQGKLAPQDSNEGNVAEAINVARKHARLPVRKYNPIEADKGPFDIPDSWCWVTVGDVAETRLGKMLDKEKNRGEPHPYLRNTNVHWFRFELDSIKTMLFEHSELEEYRVNSGDILICEGGHGIARSAVWNGQIASITFQKALHRVRPLTCLSGHFLTFCLWVYESSGILQRYYTGAGIPHFTGKSLARVSFPLPPLAEQRRIVAKVDQLMALVDQLETQLAASRASAAKLMEALVAELTAQRGEVSA